MTRIEIPDYVTMVNPAEKQGIPGLARYAAQLLNENCDLPAPRYYSVSKIGQEVRLQFANTPDSFRAMALWAERFGGTVTGEPHTDRDGQESVHCQVKFTDHGVNVEAYAFITAGDTSAA
jgi:hypothetical protein